MGEVDRTALFILAELADQGPARQARLRRGAHLVRARYRCRTPVGSSLRRLERAGLIEATCGDGLLAHTTYDITGKGRRELGALRDILLARELAAGHFGPRGAPVLVRWWATARLGFSVWFDMPLARRSGEPG